MADSTLEERLKKRLKARTGVHKALGIDPKEREKAREALERSEKSTDIGQVADLIAQGLTKFGAARAGAGPINIKGYDWEAARKRAQEKYRSQLGDIGGREAEASQLAKEVSVEPPSQPKPLSPQEELKLFKEKEKFKAGLKKTEEKEEPLYKDLSPGEEAADKKFGQERTEYISKKADIDKGIKQLEFAVKELQSGRDDISGWFIGNLPNPLQEAFFKEATDVREAIQEIVQRNLKPVLGGQFTEHEAKLLVDRAYNPALPEEINARRVESLLNQIKEAKKSKEAAIDYFNKNRTLYKFDQKLYQTADDFTFDEPSSKKTLDATNIIPSEKKPSGALQRKRVMSADELP